LQKASLAVYAPERWLDGPVMREMSAGECVLNKIFVTIFALMLSAEISTVCLAEDRYTHTANVARTEAASALAAGAFSGTLAVIADGKIVYNDAFGAIGTGKSTPPDDNTQFNAGSIGKVLTAVAMLQLREQGKIDLDKPVTHYLPRFRMKDERYGQITIRMLLNHAAGLPGTNYDRIFATQQDPEYVSQTLAVLRDSDLKSDPGDISAYCNDCFTVAQAVIERESGMRFTDYINSAIFARASMNNSSYDFKQGNQNIATIYGAGLQRRTLPSEYVNGLGSGGISTTAVDLCLFSQALGSGKLLNSDSIDELEKRQGGALGSGPSLAFVGLGWDAVSEPEFAAKGITVLSKDGITNFFRSQLYVAPKENLAVAAILAGPVELPVSDVTNMAKRVTWAALEDKGVVSRATSTPVTLPQLASIPEKLYQFEGIYGGSTHIIYDFTFDKAANTLNIATFENGRFVPRPPPHFQYRDDGRFHLGDIIVSFAVTQGGRKLFQQNLDNNGDVEVVAESISEDKSADTSEFRDTTWVPRNLSADDYVTFVYSGLYKTGVIEALPGVIYLHSGTPGDYAAYGLTDKYTGRLILPYATDQVDIKIIYKDGEKILRTDAFQFIDAKTVSSLQHSEEITIGGDGRNVARKFVSGTSFASTIPADGRILIYSPDGAIKFDSLVMNNGTVGVEPDSVIVFIGKAGATFQTQTR
jgi:CubicO group peptidase (beta-lactamase class C family)